MFFLQCVHVFQVFGEVGDIMKYVKTLRGEVRKLHATIRAVQAAEARNAANAAAEADSNNNVAQGTMHVCGVVFVLRILTWQWQWKLY